MCIRDRPCTTCALPGSLQAAVTSSSRSCPSSSPCGGPGTPGSGRLAAGAGLRRSATSAAVPAARSTMRACVRSKPLAC
eukprot:8701350-Alexandrium_andersonii.AAC.1